jgi:EAL domain-containing protein (putative c-di-GMP-specific phosphodiesterase class I)
LQPIVDLGSKCLVGFEALIRWKHQQRGLLGPNEFLGTAEASGLIVPMGSWVFRRSCEFLGALNRALGRRKAQPLFVSVNVSAKEIASPYFVDAVQKIVRNAGVSASDIKLEITETALIQDYGRAACALHQLKEAGFSIVLDDFGTGYSSLSYLHQFPFDTLKIDRSFIKHVHRASKNKAILASIASLAEHLSLSVVAEGIETSFQEKVIRDLKCTYGQGYLYAKPMSESGTLAFLQRWKASGDRELTA